MGEFMNIEMIAKKNVKDFFEDISQVLFIRDDLFGALFISISLFFNYKLFFCGLLSAIVGFVYSRVSVTPKILKDGGLLTINGLFFGIAMASLFRDSTQFYTCFIVGSLFVPLFTIAAYEVLQHWKLSPFIVSYILLVWIFTLSASTYGFQFLTEQENLSNSFSFLDGFESTNTVTMLISNILASVGRIFFLPNPSYGFMLLLLISSFRLRQSFYFLLGISIAVVAAYLLSSHNSADGSLSYYSYSAGLVALGLSSYLEKYRISMILLSSLLSMMLTVAFYKYLNVLGLPLLSLPYVITMWATQLSRTPKVNISWAR